jgi:hypothetical protein
MFTVLEKEPKYNILGKAISYQMWLTGYVVSRGCRATIERSQQPTNRLGLPDGGSCMSDHILESSKLGDPFLRRQTTLCIVNT